jgi:RNA polymerase sigma-70 factor (ECF subfamily)
MSRWHRFDVEQQLPALRRYARALTRDAARADDLVQDALTRAYAQAHRFDARRSLRAWLLAIVHNQFVSGERRRLAEARRDAAFANFQAEAVADAGQEHAAYLCEIAERFASLPEPQRAVLHLVAVEGLGYREAADALGVPIGTVMSRLSRARAALRAPEACTRQRLHIVGGIDRG